MVENSVRKLARHNLRFQEKDCQMAMDLLLWLAQRVDYLFVRAYVFFF